VCKWVLDVAQERTASTVMKGLFSPYNPLTILLTTMSRALPTFFRPFASPGNLRQTVYNATAGPSTKRQITSTPIRLARPNPKHVQAPPPPTFMTGHRIPHRTVQLVDPETNQLREPAPLHSIKYDKTTHELRLVSDSPPVVKLIDLAEEAEKAKLLEIKLKMNRKTAFEEKEVQISWTSADGDLQHKLDIAKGFLERGDRVNLVFAPKASGTPTEISQNRKEEMIAFFESGMQEYGTTWRDRETTKTTDVIYWQAKSDIMKEKKVKVSEAELEKKRLKEEKKEARRRKEEERKLKAAGKH